MQIGNYRHEQYLHANSYVRSQDGRTLRRLLIFICGDAGNFVLIKLYDQTLCPCLNIWQWLG